MYLIASLYLIVTACLSKSRPAWFMLSGIFYDPHALFNQLQLDNAIGT